MKIGMLGFDIWQGKFHIGSSRIRCDWVIKYWEEAERFRQGGKYDAIIFQKSYWVEYAKAFNGLKILDLCDPDWQEIGNRMVEMMQEVDAVTTSSEALARHAIKMTSKPVWFIPDRVDLEAHKEKKEHAGRARTAVWFGYSHNFPAIHTALKILIDLHLDLVVISNQPYHPPPAYLDKIDITNIGWGPDTVNRDILKGDIVINPKLPTGRFKFKSTNKTLTSWALGMPVAENDTDLRLFLDEAERKKEAEKRRAEVKEKWDARISVQEYKNLISELYESRTEKRVE